MPKTFLMLVLAVGILLFVKEYLQNHRSQSKQNTSELPPFPFVRQSALLSVAERNLWRKLDEAVGENNCVFGKVRLADVVRLKPDLKPAEAKKAQEPIAAMSLDFVICRRSNLSIAAAIKLTGADEDRNPQTKGGSLLEGTLAAAGVPLLRLSADSEYTASSLRGELQRATKASAAAGKAKAPDTAAQPYSTQHSPLAAAMAETCPSCGSSLVRRRVSGGRMDGDHVLACPNYPSCKHVLPLSVQAA